MTPTPSTGQEPEIVREALLPCPFCGHRPLNVALNPGTNLWWISCTHCQCEMGQGSQERVIADWNTRQATLARPDGGGGATFASAEAIARTRELLDLPSLLVSPRVEGPTEHPQAPPGYVDRWQARVLSLLEAMRDNEPEDGAADAVTCWMVWKAEAIDLLANPPPGAGR